MYVFYTHGYPPDGLELEEGEVFGQLHGLQVVEQQRRLALLHLLLPLGQLTHPVIRRTGGMTTPASQPTRFPSADQVFKTIIILMGAFELAGVCIRVGLLDLLECYCS